LFILHHRKNLNAALYPLDDGWLRMDTTTLACTAVATA